MGFAMRVEDFLDGLSFSLFDDSVGVDEFPTESLSKATANGRLACAHEAGQYDIAAIIPV